MLNGCTLPVAPAVMEKFNMGDMYNFDELLNQSKGLTNHIQEPILIKGLSGLKAVSERLVRKHPPSDPSQAQLLLAVDKVDLSKHTRNFRNIDMSKAFEAHGEPLTALDLDKDLSKRQQELVNTAIEESNRLTERSFRNRYINKIEDDWETEKRKILDRLGWTKATPAKTVRRRGTSSEGNGGGAGNGSARKAQAQAPRVTDGVAMSEEQRRYAEVVGLLNFYRRGTIYPAVERCFRNEPVVVNAFKKVAREIENPNNQEEEMGPMEDCWKLLRTLVAKDSLHCAEKCYAQEYKQSQQELSKQLVVRSIKYLEEDYYTYVRRIIRNSHASRLSNSKNRTPWVRKYLEITLRGSQPAGSSLDGYPLWHQIFVSFRCGFIPECVDILKRATTHAHPKLSQELAQTFIQSLSAYHTNGQICHQHRASITEAYHKCRADGSEDYELLMCAILGKGKDRDDPNFNSLMKTAEDRLWLALHRISIDSKANDSHEPNDTHSLEALQQKIRAQGEKRFNVTGNNPLLYFKMLLLSQQFEHAVHYLVRTSYFYLGVHVGIVLDYYGLLLRNDHQQGLITDAMRPCLNLLQIIQKCIEKPFKNHYPESAFHYIFLLSRIPLDYDSHTSIVAPALVDLILATKQYKQLIGLADPTHPARVEKMGCLYNFFDKADAQEIIAKAANNANQDEGNMYDAIKLFQLAEQIEDMGNLLVKHFSRFVAMPKENRDREELRKMTEYFLDKNQSSGEARLSIGTKQALIDLVNLTRFFNLYHSGMSHAGVASHNFEEALRLINELPFFAFLSSDSYEQPTRQLRNVDSSVRPIIEKAAVATMNIFLIQYTEGKKHLYQKYAGGASQVRLEYIRASAGKLVRAVSDSFPSALTKVVGMENQMI